MDPLIALTCTQEERSETFSGRLGASGGEAAEQQPDCARDEAAARDREEPLEEKMKGLAFRKQTSYR
ncbi:diacylglycerol kinase iota isoform X1 [Tachysurus ichikawai]